MGLQSPPALLARGVAMSQQVKFAVAITTPIAEAVLAAHKPSPQGAIALTRAATAVALLSTTLKERQQVGLQMNGEGPLGELYALSTREGAVRVTAHNPRASATPEGEVGAVVGEGRFTLIKTLASGAPYRGTVPIFTGTVAEDLAYYFATSEQVPTVCALGERVEGGRVLAAGGYFVQALPGAPEEVLDVLEARVLALPPLQDALMSEAPVALILDGLFGGDYEQLERSECAYACPCERPRFARTLLTLGREELTRLRDEDEQITLECHFCAAEYSFNREELSALISGAK